jgi:plastocyanin
VVLGVVAGALAALTVPGAAEAAAPGDRGTRATQAGSYTEVVDVVDNDFVPQQVRVEPGTTVMWTNNGRSPHNIVASNKRQDFGAPFGVKTTKFGPGDDYEFTFTTPGTYAYYCTLHGTPTSGMNGTVVVGAGSSSGSGSATTTPTPTRTGTIRVPKDFPTIQAAVDAAKPGALVLVAPGVYHESVIVAPGHEHIVIRGESRSGTILDGQFNDEPGRENGILVLADGVAVENMTARNYTVNGFFWTGVDGYRGSYLTALRNGDYGIYAFDSVNGQFDHDYGAGSPDAGFYIGQCTQCNALIVDSEAEWNGLGYSGTNAGGNLVIARSSWHDNRAGIVPNSGTGEANPPQRATTIVGNLVYDNNNDRTAAIDIAETALGNGILVFGGEDNVVARNRVYGHDVSGIAVVPAVEKLLRPDNPKSQNFDAVGNSVTDNVVEGNQYDLVLISTIDDPADAGDNCFSGNTYTTSLPDQIESSVPCTGKASGIYEAPLTTFGALVLSEKPAGADYKTVPLPSPPSLPDMPKARTAKPRPATHEPSIRISVKKLKAPPAAE